MRRFKFKLQRVLDHKLHIEEQKKNLLGEVQGKINKEYSAIQQVREKRKGLFSTQGSRQYDARQTAMRSMYFAGMDSFIKGAHSRIAALQPEIEAARKAYIEAYRERKIFENLKEKHRKEFLQQQRQAEERELAETGRMLHQKQKGRVNNA